MAELRLAREEELPRLRALWKLVFGDGDEFLDAFFRLCWRPEGALVAVENEGEIGSMLFLLPFFLVERGGKRHKMPYIYALATHPACRGRGLAGELLKYAEKVAKEWGSVGLCTLPAEPSLYDFYGKMGYEQGLYGGLYPPVLGAVKGGLDPVEPPVFPEGKENYGISVKKPAGPEGDSRAAEKENTGIPPGRMVPLEPGAYNALRRRLLEGRAYLDLPDQLIALQKVISRLSGGDLCGLLSPEGGEAPAAVTGVAAVEMDGERAVVKEGLPLGGKRVPFGMLKWFSPGPTPGPIYLGLAFD